MNDCLALLYRGRLASCNYTCAYCQFAKRRDSRAELAQDQADLERFVAWAGQAGRPLGILFTPWGEALIRRHYRQAVQTLSHLPRVRRVAIQTNLSATLAWLAECDPSRVALWCTYHPSQTSRERFLARCRELARRGIRHSVGMVGNRADLAEAEALRAALAPETYLWINANRAEQADYSPEELARWQALDPLFPINLTRHPSRGRACDAGTRALAVAGDGTVRRCHFVPSPLGNLYQGYTPAAGPCPNPVCDCHIGYIHLPHLALRPLFGDGLLERIPAVESARLHAIVGKAP